MVMQVSVPSVTRVVVPPIPGLSPEHMHEMFTLSVEHAVRWVIHTSKPTPSSTVVADGSE